MTSSPTIVGTFLAGERTVGTYQDAWIAWLSIDGQDVPLGEILADVSIRVGRDDVAGSPQPSSAAIALHPVDRAFTRGFTIGVELAVVARSPAGSNRQIFRGKLTDAELDGDLLKLVATGSLAAANRVQLDITGWPAEAWSARAARLLDTSGWWYTIETDPAFDPILEPPQNLDTGLVLFETYAASLVDAVGAAMFDTEDGHIVLQAIGARASRDHRVHVLDPAKVAWAPAWLQQMNVANIVGVQYGPDDATVTVVESDQASTGLYGRLATEIQSTRIRAAADASQRARIALARGAYPRWGMRELELLEPLLDIAIGDRVQITELPDASPSSQWTPVVEGWVHTIDGNSWRQTLTLSDPVASGLALVWDDVASDVLWSTVPPLEWRDADEHGDLYP